MGISTSLARLLMVENNRQSSISFAPGEDSAQELIQILLYFQDNLSPVLCHAPVSRA